MLKALAIIHVLFGILYFPTPADLIPKKSTTDSLRAFAARERVPVWLCRSRMDNGGIISKNTALPRLCPRQRPNVARLVVQMSMVHSKIPARDQKSEQRLDFGISARIGPAIGTCLRAHYLSALWLCQLTGSQLVGPCNLFNRLSSALSTLHQGPLSQGTAPGHTSPWSLLH